MTSRHRLQIIRVPCEEQPVYNSPNFQSLTNLHLDMLENKQKLRKNAPKPTFVYSKPKETASKSTSGSSSGNSKNNKSEDDYTLEDLERIYQDKDKDTENNETEEFDLDDHQETNNDEENEENKDDDEKEETETHHVESQDEYEDDEERERKEKDELLFSFSVLRRKYPGVQIPKYTEFTDLHTMKREYDKIIRELRFDGNVETYKQYMTYGFFGTEWFVTNMLGYDISGYALNQITGLNQYDQLLIELGEKNYSPYGSNIPVELRLLGLMTINAVTFYMQKHTFGGGANIFGGFGGAGAQQQQQKKKMKGPTVTMEDLDSHRKKATEHSGTESESEN